MNTKLNSVKVSLVLMALTLLTLARPVMAGDQVPFKGEEMYVDSVPLSFHFPFASNLTSAEGEATHLGHYTIVGVTVINVLAASATGNLTVTADNGDMLFVTLTGHALMPFSLKETVADFTITGGTGRFEGATGGWHTDSHFANAVNAGVTPNPYVAVLEGAISTVGSNKK